jgi:hypothetical protein
MSPPCDASTESEGPVLHSQTSPCPVSEAHVLAEFYMLNAKLEWLLDTEKVQVRRRATAGHGHRLKKMSVNYFKPPRVGPG